MSITTTPIRVEYSFTRVNLGYNEGTFGYSWDAEVTATNKSVRIEFTVSGATIEEAMTKAVNILREQNFDPYSIP